MKYRTMKKPELPKSLRDRLNAPPPPPLDTARQFLRSYWGDEGMMDAVREDLKKTVAISPRSVIQGLQSIESVLATSHEPGTLLNMVLWDANHPLENPNDEAARRWLLEVVDLVRNVLGDQQPPDSKSVPPEP
jgi:hypothetical protein